VVPASYAKRLAVGAVPLALLSVLSSVASAEELPPQPACAAVLGPDEAGRIFERLKATSGADGCTFEGLSTGQVRAVARFRRGGDALPPVFVYPAACVEHPTFSGRYFAAVVDERITSQCPTASAALRDLPGTGALRSPKARTEGTGARTTFLLATLAAALLSGVAIAVHRRALQARMGHVRVAALVLALALIVRAAVPHAMANWYLDVQSDRFGPGAGLLRAALFGVFPASDTTLMNVHGVIGAFAAPLAATLAFAVGLGPVAAACAGCLVAVDPLMARIAVAPGEHVVSSTAVLFAMVAWVASMRWRSWSLGALALSMLPVAALARADSLMALSVVPLLGLVTRGDATWRRRLVPALGYLLAFCAVAALAWKWVVVPSHHPTATLAEMRWAALHALPDLVSAGIAWPRWVPIVTPVLVGAGLVGLARGRRFGLAAALLVSLWFPFAAMGRTLGHDGLVGSRYFLPSLALAAVLGGAGAAWLFDRLRRPRLTLLVAPLALSALAFVAARPAYTARYAFQDEYDFLRREVPRLPAGCIVEALPMRARAFRRDHDSSLDVASSALTFALPGYPLRTLPDEGSAPIDGASCVVFYESVACSTSAEATTEPALKAIARYYARRCGEERARYGEVVAQTSVSQMSTNGLFPPAPVVSLRRAAPN
jgi:hypothetical protein